MFFALFSLLACFFQILLFLPVAVIVVLLHYVHFLFLHVFFYKGPSSKPSSKSSLFSDIFLSNSSAKSSLIVP